MKLIEDYFIENNNANNTKCTNNKSLFGINNNAKHNEVNNDNNIDCDLHTTTKVVYLNMITLMMMVSNL